jgi:hypothetical protein
MPEWRPKHSLVLHSSVDQSGFCAPQRMRPANPDGERLGCLLSDAERHGSLRLLLHDHGKSRESFNSLRADGTDVRQLTDNQWEEAASAWVPHPSTPTRGE